MFPFRRQGPKKRNKNNSQRRPRGLPKSLPNSARELLPILQPTTKALAQVLAGRSNASGQLAHAQAVLAHAERLIGERAHNRLNPSEREEFLEQLARLRLTLSDAEAEAEVVAAEEQEPRPVASPVDRERLRALALSLSTRAGAAAEQAKRAADNPPGQPEEAAASDPSPEPEAATDEVASAGGAVSAANARSGRLQLSRSGDDEAFPRAPAAPRIRRTRARASLKPAETKAPATNGHQFAEADPAADDHGPVARQESVPSAPESEADAPPPKRTRRRKTAGLPEGWVIDEEGFVVPGSG